MIHPPYLCTQVLRVAKEGREQTALLYLQTALQGQGGGPEGRQGQRRGQVRR